MLVWYNRHSFIEQGFKGVLEMITGISPDEYCALVYGYYEPYLGHMLLLEEEFHYLGGHERIFEPIPF
jgi:hypothetical protein